MALNCRLDSNTQLAFNDAHEASLSQGAVYVDSGSEAGARAADFLLETPVGSVRHLGTQYEARVTDGELRVAFARDASRLAQREVQCWAAPANC